MAKKLEQAAQASLRSKFYGIVTNVLESEGYSVEKSVNGILVADEDQFVEIKVTYKNPDKFDIADARNQLAEKEEAAAERAARAAKKAAEKAEKARKKAEAENEQE